MLKALTLVLFPVPTNTGIPQLPSKSHLHHITALDPCEAAEDIFVFTYRRGIFLCDFVLLKHTGQRDREWSEIKTQKCLESWWEGVHPEMTACPAPAALPSLPSLDLNLELKGAPDY